MIMTISAGQTIPVALSFIVSAQQLATKNAKQSHHQNKGRVSRSAQVNAWLASG